MKVKIVGFNGTPNCSCGIPVPVVRDENGIFWKMIGKKKESPITEVTFDEYVSEERITKIPETEGNDGDAILYVNREYSNKEFFEKFISDTGKKIVWVENEDFGFIVDRKDDLIELMNKWAESIRKCFDEYYHSPNPDNTRLLDLAEIIVSCAYEKNLLRKGYARLALTYKRFDKDRIKTLYKVFIKPDLGITMKEVWRMVKALEEELARE